MDSDVEVLKSFDDLLDKPYFICKENSPQGLEAAIIGAEVGCEWINKCFAYYAGKTFLNENGEMSTTVLPAILKKTITDNYDLVYIDEPSQIKRSVNKNVYVLPSDYFSPKNYVTKKLKVTKNTYTIHHFAGSWQPMWKRLLLLAWVPFSVKFPKLAAKIKAYK